MISRFVIPLVLAASAVACAPTEYTFVPATGAAVSVNGRAAADYPIGPAVGAPPQGDVRIASNGIAQLSPQDASDETVSALHLRVVIANSSDHAWTVDTRAQHVALGDRGTSVPAFATATPGGPGGGEPPLVTIAPRRSRSIDLFFPLPPDIQDVSEVPAFTMTWQVDTGGSTLTHATVFDRVPVEETPEYAYGYGPDYYDYYWGQPYGPYWYNPAYVGFYGTVFVRPRYFGHPVVIRGWGGRYYGGYRGGYHGGYHGGGFRGGGGFHGGHR